MTPEFRACERVTHIECLCTECGKPAEGDHSWTDGSGEICNACVKADDMLTMADGQVPRF